MTLPDQNATNGVIHVIDKVMYPLPTGAIPTIVAGIPYLSTLLYALATGQLVGPLSGKLFLRDLTCTASSENVPFNMAAQ